MIKSLYTQFINWSYTGSVWIISDTHFEDDDCKYMDSNWITPEEHIVNINKMVMPVDTLIHLGDVGNAEWVDKIRARRKILITGNHDKLSEVRRHFHETFTGPLFIADRILLSHEPIFGLEEFCLNIHGHDHAGTQYKNHINLASNVCGYQPVSLGKLIKQGILSDIPNYHRLTIDEASNHNKYRESSDGWFKYYVNVETGEKKFKLNDDDVLDET